MRVGSVNSAYEARSLKEAACGVGTNIVLVENNVRLNLGSPERIVGYISTGETLQCALRTTPTMTMRHLGLLLPCLGVHLGKGVMHPAASLPLERPYVSLCFVEEASRRVQVWNRRYGIELQTLVAQTRRLSVRMIR